jgi:hypothetical protein
MGRLSKKSHAKSWVCFQVSIHTRLHPPGDYSTSASIRREWIAPLPEGRGYREGIPGFAGSQAGISLKGEVSDHKGSFDESKFFQLAERPIIHHGSGRISPNI